MKMKFLLSVALAQSALLIFGAAATNDSSRSEMEAKRARMRAAAYLKTGGPVEKAGVRKGKIAILDTQETADIRSELMPALSRTMQLSRINADVVYERVPRDAYDRMLKSVSSDFALIVVSDDESIAMMIAPEDRYAVVNVKKYTRGFKSVEARKGLYNARCAKAVLKAFSLLCGGGSSRFPGNLTDAIRMESLDTVNCSLPLDMIDRYRRYLVSAGIPQRILATYRRACEQGWAPAPTNDVQKAIWDEVHKAPTAPIVIKPEPAKGK